MEFNQIKGFQESNVYKLQEKEFLPHEDVKPGEGLKLKLNLNIITLDFIEKLESKLDEAAREMHLKHKQNSNFLDVLQSEFANLSEGSDFKEVEARIKDKYEKSLTSDSVDSKMIFEFMKINIREKAMILGGLPGEKDPGNRIIHSWNMISQNGDEVPVSYETITKFSEKFIEKLFSFCKDDAAAPTNDEKKQ